jgi:hypothetical protein
MIEIHLVDKQCVIMGRPDLGGFPNPFAALKAAELLGMDEMPNRTIDRDGRMHVRTSKISKANVCDYYGREIPNWDKLGLDPLRKYRLLRHPDELAKAAATFNNLPILIQHKHVTADDHQPHLIVGTTGSDARYEHPYLKNGTSFWAGGAIDGVRTEAMNELSSSYHYRPDMTPGEYEGEAYDGVMRDIVGNHVALVRDGRAGDDVVVGDSKPEEYLMSKTVLSRTALYAAGALQALIGAKLAMDEKPIDTSAVFEGVTAKNFNEQKPVVKTRLMKLLEGVKLAQDATPEELAGYAEKMEMPAVQEGADADPETGAPLDLDALKSAMHDPGASDIDVDEKRREFLAGKLSADDMKAYDALGGAPSEEAVVAPEKEKIEDMITKPAMDEAIKSATETAIAGERRNQQAIHAAREAVEPFVGKLSLAFDSAPDVYRKALTMLGVKDAEKIHADALPHVLASQRKPGERVNHGRPSLAHDARPSEDFTTRFAGAARIGVA